MAERVAERRRRRAGEDADDDLVRSQDGRELAPDALEHLRLDREDDDVGGLDRCGVRFGRADAELALELGAALGARMAREDLVHGEAVAREQARDHRLGHHARAHGRDGRPGQ